MAGVVIDYPKMRPAKCINCGNGYDTGRRYLDTKRDVHRYGRIYFCSKCFDEFARMFGYIHESSIELVKMEVSELEGKNKELVDENDILRKSLDSLNFIERTVSQPPLLAEFTDIINARVVELLDELRSHSQSNVSSSEPRDTATETSESGSSEQNAGSGSSDILSDAEFTFPTSSD